MIYILYKDIKLFSLYQTLLCRLLYWMGPTAPVADALFAMFFAAPLQLYFNWHKTYTDNQ